MAQLPEKQTLDRSIPSLSMGNIVSVAAQISRIHWQKFFGKSLLAYLWLFLALGGAALAVGIASASAIAISGNDPPMTLTIVLVSGLAMLPIVGYAVARFIATGGLLSRLVFNILNNQEELPEVSRKRIYGRTWAYLWSTLWFFLVLLIIYCGIGLVAYVLWLSIVPLLSALGTDFFRTDTGPLALVIGIVLVLFVFLGIGLLVYYLTARLWFFDTVLALEPQVTPLQALQRSWQLTEGQGWKVTTVMFTATIVTFPLSIVASIVNLFIPLFSMLVSFVLFPFWQATKAVNYLDCASVNEGLTFDLEKTMVHPRRFLRRVAIQTPESIELDLAMGGIGSRSFAWVVDQTLLYTGLFVLWYLGAAVYAYAILPTVSETLGSGAIDTFNLWTLAIAGLLSYVVTNGYYIAFETSWQGQTPGKRLAKIRVVQDNGQPVGLQQASLRSLIGPIDTGFLFLGAFLIFFGPSEKRLGDIAAGTLVIQDEKAYPTRASADEHLSFSSRSRSTAQALLDCAHVEALTAEQYLILRDYLKSRQSLKGSARAQVGAKLVAQLQAIIVSTDQSLPWQVPDEELLEAAFLAFRNLRGA